MAYQKCPVCDGKGSILNSSTFVSDNWETCKVCRGACIIDEITGFPPATISIEYTIDEKGIKGMKETRRENA